jgi:hypothetical protein
MDNKLTIVTAFFDIKRDSHGDGRTIDEYKDWLKKTLKLNCHLFIVTEEKFADFFIENRSPELSTHLKVIRFEDSHYYKYYDKMKNILQDPEYKNRIKHPKRVECILPEYNIIQYSKFHYLQMAIQENPFDSSLFFWMDAGCSRFFMDVDIEKPYPSHSAILFLERNIDKFIVQKREDLEYYPLNDDFVWQADNLMCGTMFGGGKEIVLKINP